MSIQEDFLAEIDRFLAGAGMAETTFGRLAANDGKFVGRLRKGRTVTVAVLERTRAWMEANRPADEAAR